MLFPSWIRALNAVYDRSPGRHSRRRPQRKKQSPRPLYLERLEDRTLLSTFWVTTTGDNLGVNPAPNAGTGTLRQAILDANSTPNVGGPDTIAFNIPGTGAHTISPTTALPTITDPVIIDGYTQPGAQRNTLLGADSNRPANADSALYGDNAVLAIELKGNSDAYFDGLKISAGGSTVQGLAINGFVHYGYYGIDSRVIGSDLITGNFLGTDITDTVAQGNWGDIGVFTADNTIGGTTRDARNVISGGGVYGIELAPNSSGVYASGNHVDGNFIGTDASGRVALGNLGAGVGADQGGTNNTIGGTAPGAGNLISGNNSGIVLWMGHSAIGNVVVGNLIGTDVTGTTAVANNVGVSTGDHDTIGGPTVAGRNIISGNLTFGVNLGETSSNLEGNYIGTDVTGTTPLGNASGIAAYGNDNVVGGDTAGYGNVISGNNVIGVQILTQNLKMEGNFIGTDATGTQAVGNGYAGVQVLGSGTNSTLGGTAPGMRNIISGNYYGVVCTDPGFKVEGNFIGTDKTGTVAVPNVIGVRGAGQIGGTAAGAGNLISGNNSNGERSAIWIEGPGSVVQGNFIGTDVTGMMALGNPNGIAIDGSNNVIGGTTPSARNVIASNVGILSGSGNKVQGNYIGTNVTGTASLHSLGNGIEIYGDGNLIGGTEPGAGNLISGATASGVRIVSSGNVVQGNFIGTDFSGTNVIGNKRGLQIFSPATNNLIGGTSPGAANVISGNGDGIELDSSGNTVQGNRVLNNSDFGIVIAASNNTIGGTEAGAGNTIAGNGGFGVDVGAIGNAIVSNAIYSNGKAGVLVESGMGNSILSNSIYGNLGLGIDLGGDGVTLNGSHAGSGPNNWQTFPVLSSASTSSSGTTISGTFNSTPNTSFTLQFFSNTAPDPSGYGEGQMLLGSASANGNGSFTANLLTPVPTGQCSITATATNLSTGDTSEFAKDIGTTVTTVTSSANPSLLSQAVTFTATVSGAGNSTGTVQFQIDGVNFGSPVALNGGSASISTSTLPAGPHMIGAVYNGDGSCGSTGTLTEIVHYSFSGFLSPLNNNLALGLGRTIPIKWQLNDANGALLTSLSPVVSLQVQSVDASGNPLAAPFNPASNTGLTYDGTHYSLNWQTKGLSAGTYTVTLALADGTAYKKTLQLAANGSNAGLVVDGTTTTTAVGALLGGDLELYVNNSSGFLTTAELARIDDAVAAVDSIIAPYGITMTETSDSGLANVVLDMGSTSAVGGYADGVLGCTTATGEITIIQGWNWYAGADATGIGANQFDFEAVVTHELGHALGLGHSTDATSVMYAALGTGAAKRTLKVADLNVPDTDGGAGGLHAAVVPAGDGNGAANVRSMPSAAIIDPSLANALSISAANSNIRTTMPPTQVATSPGQEQLLPTGIANVFQSAIVSEAPQGRAWLISKLDDPDGLDWVPDWKHVPAADEGTPSDGVTGAAGDNAVNAVPAALEEEPVVVDEALLNQLYEEAGADGYWTAAFAESDRPLLGCPVVEDSTAGMALAAALGGFWVAQARGATREPKSIVAPGGRW